MILTCLVKLTKKHIDDFIKIKNAPNIKKIDSNQREKSGVVKCAGLTNKGCPCGKPGTRKTKWFIKYVLF